MSDFVTLDAAATALGVTLRTIKRRAVTLGDTETRLEGRRRLVSLSAISNGQSVTVPVTVNKVKSETTETAGECPLWDAIGEQTELFESLSATITEQARTIKHLNAAINDLLDRTVQLETMRQCDRLELTRIGQAVGAYRPVQTRQERERPVDGVSQRARPNVLTGLFGRGRVTG